LIALAAALFAAASPLPAWAGAFVRASMPDRGAHNINSPSLWIAFLGGVLALLAIDLYFASRRNGVQTFGAALRWSLFWIALSVCFGGFVWTRYGGESGLEFFAGYMLEKSLSVDNLFVFVLIFGSLRIPPEHQHRVLFWGVLGALLLRGTLIITGVALVHRYHWIIMIFGAVLVFTALKLVFGKDDDAAPTEGRLVRLVKKFLPVSNEIKGPRFFFREEGKLVASPLFVALVAAESADIIFALDSIPAVFAVTDDSFLVFSSNVCALLGLRALYFVVAGALASLRFLKPGLAAILLFVGGKMLLVRWVEVRTGTSIIVIAAILGLALGASWLWPKRVPDIEARGQ
jgi:tellurite resistance protein TerC